MKKIGISKTQNGKKTFPQISTKILKNTVFRKSILVNIYLILKTK